MKEIILSILAILPITMTADIPESQILSMVECKVDSLYRDLIYISDTNTDSVLLSQIKYEFDAVYFRNNDQNCPNEFRSVWRQNPDATKFETDIRPDRYVNLFSQFFRESENSHYTFEYKQLNSSIVKGPEFKRNREPAKLAQVLIQKAYLCDKRTYATFIDTLVIGLEEMKICAWANSQSKHPIGYFSNEGSDTEAMLINAKIAFTNKQYNMAYLIYENIIAKHPYEGEAYYRMAVMLYNKDAGNNLNKKERDTLILKYLNSAIKYGGYPIKGYAENMRYWLIS